MGEGACAFFGRGMTVVTCPDPETPNRGRDRPCPPRVPRAAFGRASGVLLHPTSLPDGRIGDEARRFVDWLASAGQRWWQVLPLGPPDAHGSPYSSPSAFAGSPSLLANPRARVSADEIEAFVRDHPYWIGDWAAHAGPDAIADQVRFAREWGVVREHARARGIRILGDIPFYVAPDSADVRSHPELFQRGEVAGVPPDDWSATGQHWGNPVYDWRRDAQRPVPLVGRAVPPHVGARRRRPHRPLPRVRRLLVDPRAAPHRPSRALAPRPGRDVFETVWRALGPVPVVAENLGVITPAVEGLREEFGMPGCVVLQFMFTESLRNRPPPPTDDNVVIYTGTHDNDTTNGWWSGLSPRAHARVDAELARLDIDEDAAELEAHPARVREQRRHCDRARPGPARPRSAGPHEPPRPHPRLVALAAPTRDARSRSRRRAPRAHGVVAPDRPRSRTALVSQPRLRPKSHSLLTAFLGVVLELFPRVFRLLGDLVRVIGGRVLELLGGVTRRALRGVERVLPDVFERVRRGFELGLHGLHRFAL